MANSPRLNWPYPDQNENPYYTTFMSMVESMDATGYANREDRSLLITKGGDFSWDSTSGVLSWAATLEIASPVSGYLLSISPGSVTLLDGQVWAVTITRAPQDSLTLTSYVSNTIPNTDDDYLIAIRNGTSVYFRNGQALGDGKSGSVFDGGVAPLGMAFSTYFGTGFDGNLLYDGTTPVLGVSPTGSVYQLNRIIYPANMTVNNGVTVQLSGYPIFCQNTLTNNGSVNDDGQAGITSSPGNNRGDGWYNINESGGGPGFGGYPGNSSGNVLPLPFCTSLSATAANANGGTMQGGGGGSSADGNGGGGGSVTSADQQNGGPLLDILSRGATGVSFSATLTYASGGGGGGSAAQSGGGGGAGGGIAFVTAQILQGTGTISANGGDGGVGTGGGGDGGGGGGGGGGGIACVIYLTNPGPVIIEANGGTGGAGGVGGSTTGHVGGNGGPGLVFKYNLSGDGT